MPMILRLLLNVEPLWNISDDFSAALSLIPASTHARINAYHFHEDRKLSLGSAILQRLLICRLYSTYSTLSSVALDSDPTTKRPFFPGRASSPSRDSSQLLQDYNTTHHNPREASPGVGERCLVALAARVGPDSMERKIGVDIVPTRARRGSEAQAFVDTFDDNATGVFTKLERERIRREPTPELRVRCLMLHWALKEAYVKALGLGLGADLLAVEFRNVWFFELIGDRPVRWTGVEMWIDGKRSNEWYIEVSFVESVEERDHGFYVTIITTNGGLNNGAAEGSWEELDYENDIKVPWGGS